jgi:hypothetical protein
MNVNSISAIYRRTLQECGLYDKIDPSSPCHRLHFHTLRKFFNTFLLTKGAPEIAVQSLLGHSGYLSRSYNRPTEEQLIEAYKPMRALRLMSKGMNGETKDRLETQEDEIKRLQQALADNEIVFRNALAYQVKKQEEEFAKFKRLIPQLMRLSKQKKTNKK